MALSEGIKRGTIELMVLTILSDGDMYGYQLAQELDARSGGRYTLQESSMYPTLYRLLEKGMITDRQGEGRQAACACLLSFGTAGRSVFERYPRRVSFYMQWHFKCLKN